MAEQERRRAPTPENKVGHDLTMTPEVMLDLARRTAELLVERIEGLPREPAWDGEFKQALDHQLMAGPPEEGRPPVEVIEQAAREILPFATRLDHPRCFGFVPSEPTWPGVLADFMASAFNVNACTWLVASGPSQVELVVIDWFRRWLGYPESAGGANAKNGNRGLTRSGRFDLAVVRRTEIALEITVEQSQTSA